MTRELVIDSFAGGGGASSGIEAALGRPIDVAINHDPEAIAMHMANHPRTRHYCESVWDVDPREATRGMPVGLAWFSPDCTFHSRARGGKPHRDRDRARRRRGLAWIVVRWAEAVRPRVIMLENVPEFGDWGPLLPDGRPCPARRGLTFRRWLARLTNLGYQVECRELRACDYGAPTSRQRLFIIARCDGEPIVWPEPTHGRGRLPYRTAAECIDWSIPVPSIFDRARPLAEATCRRIAHGVMRYVVNARQPFVVATIDHNSAPPTRAVRGGLEPLSTITTENRHALVAPTLIQTGYGEREGQAPRVPGLDKPLGTIVNGQKHAVVAAFLARHFTGVVGRELQLPMPTITAVDHHSLVTVPLGTDRSEQVAAFLLKYYGTDQDPNLRLPLHTITTKDRFGLVTVHGREYRIADIGLRMLQPRELYTAQGFRRDYRIEGVGDQVFTKSAQVRMCGNSVPPPVAEALVRANCTEAAREATAA